MKSKVSNVLIIFAPILICIGLYWPIINGQPIWDDQTFLFQSAVMKAEFPFWEIIKNFNWPVSVMLQKFLYGLFRETYQYYHLLNILLHIINALLIYLCAKRLKLSYAPFLYGLYLLHPSNVISVAWIIQFKTLICFTFGILAYLYLLQSKEKPKHVWVAILFFLMSVLSKSAAIPLVAILLGQYFFTIKRSFKTLLLPLVLISTLATLRIINSPTTKSSSAFVSLEKQNASNGKTDHPLAKQITNSLGTSYYYFWQVYLPLENAPVKGLRYDQFTYIQFGHIFFISLLFFMFRNSLLTYLLVSGYLMLLPFMGIIFAPFMNIAWVSDQHLYLAMPFFLCFGLELLKKAPWQFIKYLPYFFIIFFVYKTHETIPYYKDEMVFFESSLKTDPYNVPIAHNLIISYLEHNQLNKAMNLAETFIHMADSAPEIRTNPYFPELFLLNLRLHQSQKESK